MTFVPLEAHLAPGLALRKVSVAKARPVVADRIQSHERLTHNFRADYAPQTCWPVGWDLSQEAV